MQCNYCQGTGDDLNSRIDQLERKIRVYENSINWHTECTSCAGYLDKIYELDQVLLPTMEERAETAESRIAQLGAILPKTFFADRDIAFRLERMVDEWRRAIEANHILETRAGDKEKI